MFVPAADPAARLGAENAAARRERELALWRKKKKRGWRIVLRPFSVPRAVRLALRVLGLADRAYREFLDVRVVENPVRVRGLPPAFAGFRLLQVADLHSDLDPALVERVRSRLAGLSFDQAVLTGDYHDEIGTPWDDSLALTLGLVPALGPQPLAILGNHDYLENVPALEAGGLRVLLNENVALERAGSRLWICGVDDPRYLGAPDLVVASAGIPPDECRVLLAHSPEPAAEAARLGYALQLSGHTHGGQICLPGGRPIVKRARVPLALVAGAWEVDGMPGYTSRGTGGCSVAARLNCPPEITVHILRPA